MIRDLKIWSTLHHYYSHERAGKDVVGLLATHASLVPEADAADIGYLHSEPQTYAAILRQTPSLLGKYLIGYAVWETDRLTDDMARQLALVDEVWTASWYCHAVLSRYHDNVHWVPHVIARDPRCGAADIAAVRRLIGPPAGTFDYLCIGRVQDARKNLATLRAAFTRVHQEVPSARLIIKDAQGGSTDPRPPRVLDGGSVLTIVGHLDDAVLNALYTQTNAYVSAHRAEGWGLTLSDAMLLRRPVIAPAYSGNLDFMTAANSFLVPCQEVEVGRDNATARRRADMRWGSVDVGDLALAMVQVYRLRDSVVLRDKVEQAARDIAWYDAAHVSQRVRLRLEALADLQGTRGLRPSRQSEHRRLAMLQGDAGATWVAEATSHGPQRYAAGRGEIVHFASTEVPDDEPPAAHPPRIVVLCGGAEARCDARLAHYLTNVAGLFVAYPDRCPHLAMSVTGATGLGCRSVFDPAKDLLRHVNALAGPFRLEALHVADTPDGVTNMAALCHVLGRLLESPTLAQRKTLPTLVFRHPRPRVSILGSGARIGAAVAHELLGEGVQQAAHALPLRWMALDGPAPAVLDSSRLYFYPYQHVRGLHADELDAPLLPGLFQGDAIDLLARFNPFVSSWVAARARYARRAVPIVGAMHSIHGANLITDLILQRLEGPRLPVDCMIAPSVSGARAFQALEETVHHWLSARVPTLRPVASRSVVIPYGIETRRFTGQDKVACRHALGLPPDAQIVLCVGRLSRQEKADLLPLLLAVSALRDTFPKMLLVLCGGDVDGSYTRDLHGCIETLALTDCVRLVANVSFADKVQYYGAADVAVVLADNVQETYGLAPLEAMAAGLPVVAADWDGFRETVRHGETGFLVPTLWSPTLDAQAELQRLAEGPFGYGQRDLHESVAVDVEVLTDALRQLLRDPSLRQRFGLRGQERCRQEFEQQQQSRKIVEVYLEQIDAAAEQAWTPPVLHPFSDPVVQRFLHYATRPIEDDDHLLQATPRALDPQQRATILSLAGITDRDSVAIVEALVALCPTPQSGASLATALAAARGSGAPSPTPEALRRHILRALKYGLLARVAPPAAGV